MRRSEDEGGGMMEMQQLAVNEELREAKTRRNFALVALRQGSGVRGQWSGVSGQGSVVSVQWLGVRVRGQGVRG